MHAWPLPELPSSPLPHSCSLMLQTSGFPLGAVAGGAFEATPRARLSLREFWLASLRGERVYIGPVPSLQWPPGLSPADVAPATLFDDGRPPRFSLWVGSPNTYTHMHYDTVPNAHGVIYGEKVFYVARPSAHRDLLLYPFLHPRSRRSQIGFPFAPNPAAAPGEAPAKDAAPPLHLLRLVLRAGDVLVLPAFWFHQVATLTPASLAVNEFKTVDEGRMEPAVRPWQALHAAIAAAWPLLLPPGAPRGVPARGGVWERGAAFAHWLLHFLWRRLKGFPQDSFRALGASRYRPLFAPLAATPSAALAASRWAAACAPAAVRRSWQRVGSAGGSSGAVAADAAKVAAARRKNLAAAAATGVAAAMQKLGTPGWRGSTATEGLRRAERGAGPAEVAEQGFGDQIAVEEIALWNFLERAAWVLLGDDASLLPSFWLSPCFAADAALPEG